jgi:hypothetical protein
MRKTITIQQMERLNSALRELLDASDEAYRGMREAGVKEMTSTNYQTALRGFEHLLRFVEQLAGTSNMAQSRELIEEILDEYDRLREKGDEYDRSRKKKQATTKKPSGGDETK